MKKNEQIRWEEREAVRRKGKKERRKKMLTKKFLETPTLSKSSLSFTFSKKFNYIFASRAINIKLTQIKC